MNDAPKLAPATDPIRQSQLRAIAFIAIGVPILLYFGFVATFNHETPLAILALGCAALVSASGLWLLRSPESYLPIRLGILAYMALLLYLLAYSGPDHARGLWFLTLPLVTVMLLPAREGGLWALAGIFMAVIVMLPGNTTPEATPYSSAYFTRFIVISLLITGVLVWSEWLLQHYRKRLKAQHAELAHERDRLEDEVLQRAALEEELRYLATTDPLTGLLNRRAFMAALLGELTRSQRLQGKHTLLMLDIDAFKAINDSYGHPAGDAVLSHLAKLLGQQLRTVDRLGRIGGEEFAILLVDTPAESAIGVVDRLLDTLRNTTVRRTESPEGIRFTASLGCTESRPEDDELSIMARADRALYAAKQAGRDRQAWV